MSILLAEARKLPAFVRRDFLVALSYRMSFVSDLVSLAGQILIFYFLGRLVDSSDLPTYGGTEVTYLEFAAVGIAVAVFMQFGLQHVARAVRSEQLMGTLDSLLTTPTTWSTIQIGSAAFELLYIPLRLSLFLFAATIAFGFGFESSGILPAVVLLTMFIPFIWGLGVVAAAIVLTFRRGGGLVGLGAMLLALASGLYFPVDLLPGWLVSFAEVNPVAVVTDGMREALVGGAGWTAITREAAVLAPLSLLSLAVGGACFRLALRRERRLGTLGLY